MRGLCLPLLACACALLSLREALATNYAVSSENAKLVCGFSQALKDSAKGLTTAAVSVLERTAEASAKAAILRGRLAAMLRQARGTAVTLGGGTGHGAGSSRTAAGTLGSRRAADRNSRSRRKGSRAEGKHIQHAGREARGAHGRHDRDARHMVRRQVNSEQECHVHRENADQRAKVDRQAPGGTTRNTAGDLAGCLKALPPWRHTKKLSGNARTKTELIMKAVTDGQRRSQHSWTR
ncbi:hypothetical protein ERJ75_001553400 [Trypanosoma vivax]|nr:hypothetical protein ERJ75_001553400 [Trypanosoma vivax]